jgi:hypothetical protein
MLESAEKFEKAFERLSDVDGKYVSYFIGGEDDTERGDSGAKKVKGKGKLITPPEEGDWINIRCFIKFLKLFYGVTLHLSGSSYVTSNIFFYELVTIQTRLNRMIRSDGWELKSMAERMKVKFDKYWENQENLNYYVAIVLDPRYKLKYVKFWFEKMYDSIMSNDLINKVESTLKDLSIIKRRMEVLMKKSI